jgi:hypothetical protein
MKLTLPSPTLTMRTKVFWLRIAVTEISVFIGWKRQGQYDSMDYYPVGFSYLMLRLNSIAPQLILINLNSCTLFWIVKDCACAW